MLLAILSAVWLLCCMIQLFYWLVVAWPLGSFRSRIAPNTASVSVIVCAHEMTPQLPQLIEDILEQKHPEFELIIVNDGSNKEIENLADGRFRMLHFDPERKTSKGKKEALAFGIAKAKYDWILVTDADCAVRPSWISTMMQYGSVKRQLVLGYSPSTAGRSLAGRLHRFDSGVIAAQYLSSAIRKRAYMGVGRNMLYSKKLYEQVGGFASHIDLASGDDDLFVQEAREQTEIAISLDPDTVVETKGVETWKQWLRQKRRHMSTSVRYPREVKIKLAFLAGSYITFWILGLFLILSVGVFPAMLFAIVMVSQWLVFWQLSPRLELTKYVPTYPLWALVYSLFLIAQGLSFPSSSKSATWN